MALRFLPVLLFVAAMVCVPWFATGNAPVTIMTQLLVWVVFALSYNIVLGQTGLLSFCHAVFFGAGAFAASHIIVSADGGVLSGWPVWLTPLPAFAVGAITALIIGLLLANRVGVAFVMITLAISQLVIYLAITFDSIFGGEAGIGIDRAYDDFLFGLASFGPTSEAYWLVLFWTVVSAALIWLQRQTAFGMLAEGTRENEERVRFSGQSTYRIRLMSLVIAGGFAGLAGALHALNVEQVSTDQFSLKTSAFALFMCVIGGSRNFFGPIVGAATLTALDKILPDYSSAWLLYLGLIFCVIILYAPNGIAGVISDTWHRYASGDPSSGKPNLGRDAATLLGAMVLAAGAILGVEMAFRLGETVDFKNIEAVSISGIEFNPTSFVPWLLAAALLIGGRWILKRAFAGEDEGVAA